MKFFLNQLQIKLVSLTIVIALITFIACKRTTDVQNTNDNFAVKEAKDWYYGYFKKSIYFKNLNTNSPFVSNFEQNVASKSNNIANGNLKKSPKWSLAQSVTINGVQIVEVPILYDVTTVMLPGTQNKTQSIKKQMANASLSKILFIKQANGSVAIRLVTIVPTVEYAAIKNYDISSNSAVNLDDHFSGYIMVRKWDETPIKTLKILDGSSFRNVTMRKRVNNTGSKVQTEGGVTPCYWVWVPQIFRTCAIAYQGDEPDHECEEWNEAESPTEGSWELNEDCGDSGDFEDEDLCLMFGIGCDEDEEDPCIMYGNCGGEDNCEATCEINAAALSSNSSPTSEELSIDTWDIGNFRKRKDPKWTCHRGTGWILTSKEEGVVELYDVPNNKWRWISFEHNSITKTGISLGGTIDIVNDTGTPSFTSPSSGQSYVFYASMALDYSIKYSPVCDCPIVSQVLPPYTLYYQSTSTFYEAKP